MVKKTFTFFWSLRHQFIKYFIIGIGAVILDMSTLLFFKEILKISPVIAVTANQILVLIFVFLLNKYWSFKENSMTHRQLFRFGILVIYNYSFAVVAMYVFNNLLKFDYRLVRLGSIILAVSWNFFLYKYWVYTGDKSVIEKLLNDQQVVKIMSNNPNMPEAEARAISSTLNQLSTIQHAPVYQTAPKKIIARFKDLSPSFWDLSKVGRAKYYSEVVNKVIEGKTISQAIQLANQLFFGVLVVNIPSMTKPEISMSGQALSNENVNNQEVNLFSETKKYKNLVKVTSEGSYSNSIYTKSMKDVYDLNNIDIFTMSGIPFNQSEQTLDSLNKVFSLYPKGFLQGLNIKIANKLPSIGGQATAAFNKKNNTIYISAEGLNNTKLASDFAHEIGRYIYDNGVIYGINDLGKTEFIEKFKADPTLFFKNLKSVKSEVNNEY